MLLIIGYVGLTVFLTSRRAGLTRSTLAIAAGTGLLFGLVMLAVDPLGFSNRATNPWLPGSTADPLVVLAWILLFGGPVAAAALTGWRCRGPDGPGCRTPSGSARASQPRCWRTGSPRCSLLLSAPARPCWCSGSRG